MKAKWGGGSPNTRRERGENNRERRIEREILGGRE